MKTNSRIILTRLSGSLSRKLLTVLRHEKHILVPNFVICEKIIIFFRNIA